MEIMEDIINVMLVLCNIFLPKKKDVRSRTCSIIVSQISSRLAGDENNNIDEWRRNSRKSLHFNIFCLAYRVQMQDRCIIDIMDKLPLFLKRTTLVKTQSV